MREGHNREVKQSTLGPFTHHHHQYFVLELLANQSKDGFLSQKNIPFVKPAPSKCPVCLYKASWLLNIDMRSNTVDGHTHKVFIHLCNVIKWVKLKTKPFKIFEFPILTFISNTRYRVLTTVALLFYFPPSWNSPFYRQCLTLKETCHTASVLATASYMWG